MFKNIVYRKYDSVKLHTTFIAALHSLGDETVNVPLCNCCDYAVTASRKIIHLQQCTSRICWQFSGDWTTEVIMHSLKLKEYITHIQLFLNSSEWQLKWIRGNGSSKRNWTFDIECHTVIQCFHLRLRTDDDSCNCSKRLLDGSQKVKCENCVCTLGFIKSKDFYGGGKIKRGMRENESLPELGLLTADNVSPSGASTVIHHLWRYNRSWPRVMEPPEGRIDCDERAVCLLLQCIDIVTSEWDFNSSWYHFTTIILGDLLHYSYVIFMTQFQVHFCKRVL